MRRLSIRTTLRPLLYVCGLFVGCGDEPLPPQGPFVEVDRWSTTPAPSDPFREYRPAQPCALPGYQVETAARSPVLEINTDDCGVVTVSQPLQTAVPAQLPLLVNVAHLALSAPDSATATIAFAVGEDIVWQTSRSIPRPPDIIIDTFSLPRDASEGTQVFFHIRNHGANSYYLQSLEYEITAAEN